MKKAIELVNNTDYQALFLKHITLESPIFIQNNDEAKLSFLFNTPDPDSVAHDDTIRNSYAFLSTDQGLFALTADKNDPNQTRVIFVDDEAKIHITGSTPVDFVINLEYLTLDHEVRDLDSFLAAGQAQFGDVGPMEHFFALNAS